MRVHGSSSAVMYEFAGDPECRNARRRPRRPDHRKRANSRSVASSGGRLVSKNARPGSRREANNEEMRRPVDKIGTVCEPMLQLCEPRRNVAVGENRLWIPAAVGREAVVEYVESADFRESEISLQVSPQLSRPEQVNRNFKIRSVPQLNAAAVMGVIEL